MALNGFKGLGWILGCAIIAPGCYMVTSHGAAERAKLKTLEANIIAAHKDIRGLETEFNARANMAQLERWNGDYTAMAAPTPQQFASETQLASIEQPQSAEVQTASLVVPAGAPPVNAAQPATPSAAQPAVLAAAVARVDKAAKTGNAAVAQAMGAGRARSEAVAMVDDKLLSASTVSELEKRAHAEQLALR